MKTLLCGTVALTVLLCSTLVYGEEIAARVNGIPITEAKVQDVGERIRNVDGRSDSSPESLRQDALQSLIDLEVLTQQAKAEKIEASAEEVEQQLNQIKAQYQTPEAYQQALTTNKANEVELRRELANSLIMQKLVDRHVSAKVAPDAVEKYYKEHPDDFQRPAQVKASHILFRITADADASAVKKRAEETLARLKKGEDFAKLAKELSDDAGSAQNGGDLGFFAREAMVKPFADAAFGLKKDELSGIVETQFGLHIIKVTDIRGPGLAPLVDVKADIQEELEEDERDRLEQGYLDDLKKKAKIEIVEHQAPTPAPTVPTPPA